ncbi:hypothetical protein EV361DRAFT_914463 [Lentinula raphanica]|nr:hypothetical protein EV361DRAFT_914463 [Lentinula raphanica]
MTLGWRVGVLTSLAAVVPFGPVLLTPLVSGLSLFSPAWGLSLLNFGHLCSPGLLVPVSLCLCSPGLLVPISLLCAGTSGAPVLCLLHACVCKLCACHCLLSGVGLTGRTVSLTLRLLGLRSS